MTNEKIFELIDSHKSEIDAVLDFMDEKPRDLIKPIVYINR